MNKEDTLATIAKTYEQNIGFITPMVRDDLIGIADTFPAEWFVDAV